MNPNGLKIREQILALLSRKDYRPLNKIELARKLGIVGRPRAILRRTLRELERAGEIARIRKDQYVVPADPRFVHDVYVASVAPVPDRRRSQPAATVGDKVVIRLDSWTSRHVNPEGEIIEVLGPASAPGVDMLSIIRKYHLPTEFPGDVIDQANRISETVDSQKLEGREDLRKEFIITVDPDDARDFDDAIDVEKIDNGGWRLGVHIADVAAYVEPGSALDREAYRRGNSVYLPDRVIPMLPERLSNGVCSLNPGVDRLTHSVFIHFDKRGVVRSAR